MQDNQLSQQMKQGMRRLASGVSVLSATLSDATPFVMTVSSVTSVSDSPASLLVCINRQIQRHEELLPLGSRFAVNLLHQHQTDVSNLCAGRFQDQDRLSLGQWQQDNWLVLADSQASFCCTTDQVVNYGTHAIVIGRIERVMIHRDQVDPLLYANGQYGSFKPLI